MRILVIALLVLACMADDKFKETEKTKSGPGAPPAIKLPENIRLKISLTDSFNFAVGVDMAAQEGLLKFNLYSDLGDFEHFNLFDFNNVPRPLTRNRKSSISTLARCADSSTCLKASRSL
ncbi:MAG: hypothetical protein P4L10_14500 [Acidobacteriaceae bacterium]|nr:hypothetical protein [Acidobacteriaceae bacterium]